MKLSSEQIERYSRNIIMDQVGLKGQLRLLDSSVLVVGIGGLGSPAAYYLAAAGVGRIGIFDSDRVDISNLQRQIMHNTADLGRLKVESAAAKLQKLNPDLEVRAYAERLTSENAVEIISKYDFVIDCTDNFQSKFLINDACFLAGKPFAHAGILRFEGQMLTVKPGESSCYRCVFPEPPPRNAVPTCADAGVLGALGGIVGSLQAAEAIKYLLGKGDLLLDRLLIVDAFSMHFREIKVVRSKDCPICGENPSISELREEK